MIILNVYIPGVIFMSKLAGREAVVNGTKVGLWFD